MIRANTPGEVHAANWEKFAAWIRCPVQILRDFLGITVLPERLIDTQTHSSEQSTRKTQEVHCAHCDRDGILVLLL